MKFTEKIKDKIDNAKSEEEVKSILENVKDGADKEYSGLDNPSNEEKLIRKAIGLPIKKQLIRLHLRKI